MLRAARWATCLMVSVVSIAQARAAEGPKAFTVAADKFGPVYRVDMEGTGRKTDRRPTAADRRHGG